MADSPVYFRWSFEGGLPVIEWMSNGLVDLLGIEHPDLKMLWAGLDEADRGRVRQAIDAIQSVNRSTIQGVLRWRGMEKETRWIEVVAVREPATNQTFAEPVWHGFARRRPDREGRSITYGRFDELTGLANRAEFLRALHDALNDDRRRPAALLFLDLDGFKLINDQLGHQVGDAVLRAVADRLRTQIRHRDVLARYGGDEFALILHPLGGRDQAVACARRLKLALARPLEVQGHCFHLDSSIGLAIAPDEATTSDALISLADHRMYDSKRHVDAIQGNLFPREPSR